MTFIDIQRIEQSEAGTIGVLSVNKSVVCFTLEPRWRMNERGISCIPPGQYYYHTYYSNKYNKMCVALHDVHGRDYISIHHGNSVKDTKGCVLPGMSIGLVNGRRAVIESKKALDRIIVCSHDKGMVVVRDCY